ncbi:hypothetical protein [Sphingopyxis sp.]|uniref:hypothetical protein n=1 Tax=Sphingopyxis sp. TaxID=1908224 RepID=UPI0010FA31B5|nr:hypothetical protein [Sphingopyxis sp.]MBR2173954.1 hypothetical protein [Sphingopyxis sp.]
MAFREKIDWLSFAVILLGFSAYFWIFPYGVGDREGLAAQAGLLIALAIIFTIVMTIAATLLALMRPRDANAPADERDRNITRRASGIAYYVLIVGLAGCFALAHITRDLVLVLNAVLAAAVVAELVRLGLQIRFYRTGA